MKTELRKPKSLTWIKLSETYCKIVLATVCIAIAASALATPVSADISAKQQSQDQSTSSAKLENFLTPDGRIDMQAVNEANIEGSIDLSGWNSAIDESTGEPIFRQSNRVAADPDDIYWDNSLSAGRGVFAFARIHALTVYNGELIVGGGFRSAGSALANNIAAWDGKRWRSLGAGLNGQCLTLAVYESQLIAGGSFSSAGNRAVRNIAKWDGSTWQQFETGLNGSVRALLVHNGELVVGGSFVSTSLNQRNILKWDGTDWQNFDGGMNGAVYSLKGFNGNLVAGGRFTTAGGWLTTVGGSPASRIALWNGTSWTSLGDGFNDQVNSVEVYRGVLIAGGEFTASGVNLINHISSWDGTAWDDVRSGTLGNVWGLHVFGDSLYVAGDFQSAGGITAQRISIWNGQFWSEVGGGVSRGNEYVSTIGEFDGSLVIGGDFAFAGSEYARNLAILRDDYWKPIGNGFMDINGSGRPVVSALETLNGTLFAGGKFQFAGDTIAQNIAMYNGVRWSEPGGGFTRFGVSTSAEIKALTVYKGQVIAAGRFDSAGGTSSNNIAAWDGSRWHSLGMGTDNIIHALTNFDGKLIVGGAFSLAGGVTANKIAAWDGSSWSQLGLGFSRSSSNISALHVINNKLIAAGDFSSVNGQDATDVASWDGSQWTPLGTGLGGFSGSQAYALSEYRGKLIVGGRFDVNSVRNVGIAALEGDQWQPLGAGLGTVRALSVKGDSLFAGFDRSGSTFTSGLVAVWDGFGWLELGSGLLTSFGSVFAMKEFNGQMLMGGEFREAGNGQPAVALVAWGERSLPTEPPMHCSYSTNRINVCSPGDTAWIQAPVVGANSYSVTVDNPGVSVQIANDGLMQIVTGSRLDSTFTVTVTGHNGADTKICNAFIRVKFIDELTFANHLLVFYTNEDDSTPPDPQTVSLLNACGTSGEWTVGYDNDADTSWLSISRMTGTTSVDTALTFTVTQGGTELRDTVRVAQLTVTGPDGFEEHLSVVLFVDPGAGLPDIVAQPGDIVEMPLYVNLDSTIGGFTIPLSYKLDGISAEFITLDTVIFDTALVDSVIYLNTGGDIDTVIIVALPVPIRDPKLDTSKTVANLVFSISPDAPPAGLVTIDTVTATLNGASYALTFFGETIADTLAGTFQPGTILLGIKTSITEIEDGSAALPKSFALHQNYPNPFNPSTTIEFDMAKRADVTLEVFNVLGQKVYDEAFGELSAGSYKVVWDAGQSDAASGVYFYRLTVGDLKATRKMVLLK